MRSGVHGRCLASASGAALTLLVGSNAARADELPAPSGPPATSAPSAPSARAAMAEDVTGYYRSERNTAFTFIGLGVVSAGVGTGLVTTRGDFATGLGVAMISIGALEVLGSTFYAFQVGAELGHYSGVLARDPAQFKGDESVHIHGTTSRFFWYRASELALVVAGAGVATYGFVSDRDVWKGVGIGVAAEAATFFVLDAFGSARAVDYEEHVNRFDPSVAFSIGDGARPWSLAVGGKF
ncbi:MAG: hypothetical protein JWO86_6722 [Myxococcaceae bacterium]|nr:hypothetical protein [Myxococcaceae bacterium]